MSKFQPGINFGDIGEFLHYLPEDQREMVERLREIMFRTVPGVREKLSYNVPFFFLHTRIAFIWPSSVPWGGTKLEGVALGFARGSLMSDPEGLFAGQTQKQIRQVIFRELKELNNDWTAQYLLEAVALDEEIWEAKQKK